MTLVEQNPLGSKDFLFKQVDKKSNPFFIINVYKGEIDIFFFINVSGKYRDGDEHHLVKPPFAVCKDFSAAVDQILALL